MEKAKKRISTFEVLKKCEMLKVKGGAKDVPVFKPGKALT